MNEPLLLNTLEEAASWLSEKTKLKITAKQVLNAEIIDFRRSPIPVNPNKSNGSRLYIAFPRDAKFSRYIFDERANFVFKGYANWMLAPMFLVHLWELFVHEETTIGIAQYPEDYAGDGESYVFLEPALKGQLANLSMVRIKKEGLEAMLKQLSNPDTVSTKLTEAQEDKLNCQLEAKQLWEKDSSLTQAEIMADTKVAPYLVKYKGKNTVPNWLSEIDPRPKESRRGRPKKIPA